MAICFSTIFWGIIGLVGLVLSFVLRPDMVTTGIGTLALFWTLYTIQCLCTGGCWVYAWIPGAGLSWIFVLTFCASIVAGTMTGALTKQSKRNEMTDKLLTFLKKIGISSKEDSPSPSPSG